MTNKLLNHGKIHCYKGLLPFVLVLIAITFSISCTSTESKANTEQAQQNAVKSEVLIQSETSWDGEQLPPYPKGQPQVTLVRYSIPANTLIEPQMHKLINGGIVVSGELTLQSQDGALEKKVVSGEAFVGSVDNWYYAMNRASEDVDLIMAYIGVEDTTLGPTEEKPLYTIPEGMSIEGVKSDTLLCTSTSWDGVKLEPYPSEQPTISIVRFNVPPKSELPPHFHTIINFGVILSGEITVLAEDGSNLRTMHSGEGVEEMVTTWHHGENRGDSPTDLVMFYAGTPTSNLSDTDSQKKE